MGLIDFYNVTKVYDNSVVALDDVSFTIEKGEFVFLIGASGAGKSTLIKLLTCEEKPTEGKVELDGIDITHLARRDVPFLRRRIGMIFQDFRLIESKTVAENVAFAMEIIGVPQKEIKRKVNLVLAIVGLSDKAETYPSKLSGGEAQRVGIARALVNNPALILADEPTGNLDPVNGESVMALLERINKNGTTVIACTHDIHMVSRMKKRVIEINRGILVRDEAAAAYSLNTDVTAQSEKYGENVAAKPNSVTAVGSSERVEALVTGEEEIDDAEFARASGFDDVAGQTLDTELPQDDLTCSAIVPDHAEDEKEILAEPYLAENNVLTSEDGISTALNSVSDSDKAEAAATRDSKDAAEAQKEALEKSETALQEFAATAHENAELKEKLDDILDEQIKQQQAQSDKYTDKDWKERLISDNKKRKKRKENLENYRNVIKKSIDEMQNRQKKGTKK